MRNRLFALIALSLSVALAIGSGSAADAQQQQVCMPLSSPDSVGYYLIDKVSSYTAPVDSAYEAFGPTLGIPMLPPGVVLVLETQEAVCKKLAAAYKAKLGAAAAVSGRIYAVGIGAGRYVVLDPNYVHAPGGAFIHMVIDSKYVVQTVFR